MAQDDTTNETELERARRSKRERQARWRARTAARVADEDEGEGGATARPLGASVTLHLTDAECAALDMIAAQLYRDNPHDPAEGIVGDPVVFPGRPAAVRLLIAAYRKQTKVRRPAGRNECADFWRVECAFRQATREDTRAEAPEPPWTTRRR